MKLLSKTSLIYLLSTTLVFLLGGLVFYYNLRTIVDEEATERIYGEKSLIENFVKQHDTIPISELMTGDFIKFVPCLYAIKENLHDTSILNVEEEEFLPYRTLDFSVSTKEKHYSVSISKPLFESDDLIEAIILSFIIVTIVLLVITVLVNRIASKKLFKPFFNSIQLLNEYKIDNHDSLQFEKTSTSEFKDLNLALGKMTDKISSDYGNLKAFTENASHELQTPLTVILLSTENLLQQQDLNEKQLESIQTIHQTARKLSKLNQTLLLLAKIENRQFEETENVNLGELIESKLELFSELISHKGISLKQNISKNIFVKIHPVLADVMVSNLLTNAIRHNQKNGIIAVELSQEKMTFCNSGEILLNSSEKLFERFYKENTSSESTGLGLALVKQVVDTNGMSINYSYREKMHCFEIKFR